jgi:hypothetical protein
VLLIRTPHERTRLDPAPFLTAYDASMLPRIDLGVISNAGQPPELVEYRGDEYLSQGFQLLRIWDANGTGVNPPHEPAGQIHPAKFPRCKR